MIGVIFILAPSTFILSLQTAHQTTNLSCSLFCLWASLLSYSPSLSRSTTGLWHCILTNQLFLVLAKQTWYLQAYISGLLESPYKANLMAGINGPGDRVIHTYRITVASLLKLTNNMPCVSSSFSTGLTAVSLRSHAKGSVQLKETFTSLSLTLKFYKLLNKWAVLSTQVRLQNHGYWWASGLISPAIKMTELCFTYTAIHI